jgi:hypothetical protein
MPRKYRARGFEIVGRRYGLVRIITRYYRQARLLGTWRALITALTKYESNEARIESESRIEVTLYRTI